MKITLFIKNTVILAATGLLLRSVGVFFRVWIADTIGSEGMGLYQLIFSVYMLAATFASSGVCTAVTRLVADEESNGRRAVSCIMRKAVTVTVAAAVISTFIIYFFARPIAIYLLKDERAILSLKILSLSLPFMGLSSCARGYFIARRKTIQPSLVQLLEQTVRIATVVVCISLTASKGLEYTAAAVLLGDVVAETVSFAVNWLLYLQDRRQLEKGHSVSGVFKKIMHIALPITGSSYISSVLHTAENLLVPQRLTAFHGTKARGLELFGAIRGMALPILFFPASFLTSLSTLLIPEVSSAAAAGNVRKVRETVSYSVETTLILSTFAACVFMFNAADIGNAVYGDSDVGQIIRVLSPIVPFMYLESVTAGLLKGLDCQMNMFRYNTIDSLIRIAAVFFLLPMFGIKGYLGIMAVSNCFTSSLSAVCLFRTAKIKPDLCGWVLKPLCVGIVGGLLGTALSAPISGTVARLVVSVTIQATVCAAAYLLKIKRKRMCTAC